MSAFFTSSFFRSFPDFIDEHHGKFDLAITLLMRSICKGYLQVFVDEKILIEVLEDLKKNNHPLYSQLNALTGSAKITTTTTFEKISKVSSEVIGFNISNEIIRAIASQKDTVFHDEINYKSHQDKISRYYQKPIFIKEDLLRKDSEFLFDNMDFTRELRKNFNWEDLLKPYVLPFKNIRLIDPYLYKNIFLDSSIDLPSIIEPLAIKSGKHVCIQIISNLTPRGSNWTYQQCKEKVLSKLINLKNFKGKIELYSQKSDVSPIFHRRGIWTDFWYLRLDRGFDIINEEAILKFECDFSLIGKYSSDFSTWHQINNNWSKYKSGCQLFTSE